MKLKTLISNSSEKYDKEISILNHIISVAESKNPQYGTPAFLTLQQMKKRREAIYLAIQEPE
ncbi:hypothetical protein [Leadbetterella sp. DM7]|uniref:hypothetical protein n=1 Tax=Leadbetterella sp. DM7 TaxID=3235085 RepID=UPI00349F00C2